MKIADDGRLTCSPTDLANFLACRHKTSLDLLVAQKKLASPNWKDPLAEVLRRLGNEHEERYVKKLTAEGQRIVDLSYAREEKLPRDVAGVLTIEAMRSGVDLIVQPPIAVDGWFGYADVLCRVDRPSALWPWSYEVHDTKLSRETRGGTILQLCVYTELVGAIQGAVPKYFHVVTPDASEKYRFGDFAAFYRQVKADFRAFTLRDMKVVTYPDPAEHCEVCRWFERCNGQRRKDDHLTFVAGLGRVQQTELETRGIDTLTALAGIPVPLEFKPRGSKETYEKLHEQARLQLESKGKSIPVHELLAPEKPEPGAAKTNLGLMRLPEPDAGDLFLALEGDVFGRHVDATVGPTKAGEGTRDYLIGIGRRAVDGTFTYTARWAFNDTDERAAFDAIMDEIKAAIDAHPGMHVYHYGHYEPSAFKRLMGRYAAREADVDELLRAERFVDLLTVVRRSLRAGVERYSIKDMEPFYAFTRDVDLPHAGDQRRVLEAALETNDLAAITPEIHQAVEGYNRDDCRSTLELRDWLERLRADVIASGLPVPRPASKKAEASDQIAERQARINALRPRLLHDVPVDAAARTPDQHARYLLAYSLDWHNREDKSGWWEYFRLMDLSDDDLLDEPGAVSGLEFVGQIEMRKKSVVCRYRFPQQEIEIRVGDTLKLKDDKVWGDVVHVDRAQHTIDVLVGPSKLDWRPSSAFSHTYIPPGAMEDAIERIGIEVAEAGPIEACALPLVRNLLLRQPPIALDAGPRAGESPVDRLVRLVDSLEGDVLAIQGPPGSGKTFSGAKMIASLVAQGKKVGVVATGHKVIRKLLDDTVEQASAIRAAHRGGESRDEGDAPRAEPIGGNPAALAWLSEPGGCVLGGTAWLWARPEFAASVDVLFVDEAGQMSLANVLAVSQAAKNLVLLGDPQQLEQPQKGSHPDGVDVSALQHILGAHQTMPADRGVLLPVTWRLAPAVCAFTSEVFYEGKLTSRPGLEKQRLQINLELRTQNSELGTQRSGRWNFTGAGLWVIPVEHDGNRNASDEEVAVVADLAAQLFADGSMWIDDEGVEHQLTVDDILVVAPYNAQVSRLRERLGDGFRVGTVDKFQGQEAPIVIYSMATSRPEDAPRGMEFLYSLNRLNVATSRAKCASILVANPRLFEPECRSPRQMRLANALCRYREMAEGRDV